MCVCVLNAQYHTLEYTSATSLDAAGFDMMYLGLLIVFHMVLTIAVDVIRNSPYAVAYFSSGLAAYLQPAVQSSNAMLVQYHTP